MADLSPAQTTAKTVLRELRRRTAMLFPPAPSASSSRPTLQLSQRPTFTTADRQLVGAWKAYLKWEESNPLDIEDKSALVARLQGIYRKALIRMRFFSEIWYTCFLVVVMTVYSTSPRQSRYLAYVWTSSVGKQEEAINLLKSGIEANPTRRVHYTFPNSATN